MSRPVSGVLTGVALILGLAVFLRLIWMPDPNGTIFLRAGQLEAVGQPQKALEFYEMIASRHPESSYAPRALQRSGDLLAAQGRESGNKDELRQSIDCYVRLATNYPSDTFALTALQNAGQLAAQDLKDRPLARGIYQQIIKTNGQNTEIGAGAVVKLARLAIDDGNGQLAQGLLQEILRKWRNNANVGAEAQYFLGVCYETVFHKVDWASRAYDQVSADYPQSDWATQARERLGLIQWKAIGGRAPTHRVMLAIQPIPDQGTGTASTSSDDALWGALRIALAARGLSGDTALVRGYSLLPFYAGLNPDDPGQVVSLKNDAWQNVAAAAGFRYTVEGGGREDEALRNLQDDLDTAHLPLVYWQDRGKPVWSLAVGYDTERGEIMLQNQGAQFDTLAAKTWAPKWKAVSPFGKNYTLISLVTTGTTPNPKLTPTPAPTPAPGQTPVPVVSGPPTFVWGIAPLKESVPIGRTAERAAMLLLRNSSNNQLVNAGALGYLADSFAAAAREARTLDSAPASTPEPTATFTPEPEATSEGGIYDPTPTSGAETTATESPREALTRAQSLWAFWNAPATTWIARRREAAQWCRLAALKTNNPRFNRAADAFDQSADILESAAKGALAVDVSQLSISPNTLENLASQCRQARDAEREAAQALGGG